MSELGDVLELMHGARHRYRTIRAAVHEWRHVARAHAAFERAAQRSGAAAYAWVGWDDDSPPEAEETSTRIWWAPPGRFRIERQAGDLAGQVTVGNAPRWWIAEPDGTVIANEGDEHDAIGALQPFEHLFDPARIVGWVDLEVRGRERHAARPAIRVGATPRDVDREHLWSGLLDGADRYELLVDAERGVLLETVALLDGQPAHFSRADDVVFDEDFSPELFFYEPRPGARVRRAALAPRLEQVPLEEAASRVPFQLWKVPRLGPGWSLRVLLVDENGELEATANLHYFREDAVEQFSVVQRPATSEGSRSPPGAATVEYEGERFHVLERDGRAHFTLVSLMRGDTGLELHSQQLGGDRLVELAASLVPA